MRQTHAGRPTGSHSKGSSRRRPTGSRRALHLITAGLTGLSLAGGLVAVGSQASAADGRPFTLTMTSGTWQVQTAAPDPLLKPTTITGTIDPDNGAITNGTFNAAPKTETNQGSTEIIHYFSASNGQGAGSISSDGTFTYADALTAEIHVTSPVDSVCTSTPLNVVMKSTAPWNPAVGDVTLEAKNFHVPNFHCTGGLAGAIEGPLNTQFAGDLNKVSVSMHTNDDLPIPAPPSTQTTTALTVSPDGPQLIGTPVTLTATISSGDAVAADADGSVDFTANGVPVGTSAVHDGVATLTTTGLPAATNQLRAVYSGDPSYAGSTSDKVAYKVQPLPAVSLTTTSGKVLPGNAVDATLTVTNPAGGADWSNLYVALTGLIRSGTSTGPTGRGPDISWQDTDGTWCPVAYLNAASTGAFLTGPGATSCAAPTSFALTAGSTLTVPVRIAYPADATLGAQAITATLNTGTCVSATACTAVTPLSGTVAPKTVANFSVVAPNGVRYDPVLTVPANSTQAQGLSVAAPVTVNPVAGSTNLPKPTGTVTWEINGKVIQSLPAGSQATSAAPDTSSRTGVAQVATAGLSPGNTYTVVVKYAGDDIFKPASSSFTVTVTPPPPGAFYDCVYSQSLSKVTYHVGGVVTAHGSIPSAAPSGALVPVDGAEVTLTTSGFSTTNTGVSTMTVSPNPIGFALTSVPAASNLIGFGAKTATWSNVSGSVVPSGAPGDRVPVGLGVIEIHPPLAALHCEPIDADKPATFGTVAIAGTTLSVTPDSPVKAGTLVTMSATVAPVPATAGQVTFFDDGEELGTVAVNATTGKASFSTDELGPGTHHLQATWNGGPSIGGDTTSNAVDLVVSSPTTTSVTSSASPSTYGDAVSFSAAVTSDGGTPTGSVQFKVDGANSGSPVTLGADGTATSAAISSLTAGSHNVTAVYSGDGAFDGSTSAAFVQKVNKSATSLKATPVIVQLKGLSLYLPNLNAKVLDASGRPVAGVPVSFVSGGLLGGTICMATTNGQGVASCNGTSSLLQTVLGLGYSASFGGNDSYLASSGKAALIS